MAASVRSSACLFPVTFVGYIRDVETTRQSTYHHGF